jgi:protein-disulfide isomerase
MKNTWIWGVTGLVIVGIGAMIFARSGTPTSPQDESVRGYDFKITESDHVKGPDTAVLTFVEFSDFQCPACRSYEGALSTIMDEFPGQIRLVYKHFPLRTIHPQADLAARASVAASLQGKFWEMHDILFEKQNEWSRNAKAKDLFITYAGTIGINTEQFTADLEKEEVRNKVNSDYALGMELEISGTPTLYLNNKLFERPQSLAELRTRIASLLEQSQQ